MGPLFTTVILEQFLRIRDADRFWFENVANGQVSTYSLYVIFESLLNTQLVYTEKNTDFWLINYWTIAYLYQYLVSLEELSVSLRFIIFLSISAPRALSCSLLYCIIVIFFYNLSKLNIIWYDMIWNLKCPVTTDDRSFAVNSSLVCRSLYASPGKHKPFCRNKSSFGSTWFTSSFVPSVRRSSASGREGLICIPCNPLKDDVYGGKLWTGVVVLL